MTNPHAPALDVTVATTSPGQALASPDQSARGQSRAPLTQAQRVIAKFGGVRALAKALQSLPDPKDHRHWSVIYRWQWPLHRSGRGGRIPTPIWPALLKAARLHGIYLTEADLNPREDPRP